MYKRKVGRTFSRKAGPRRAFIKSLLRALALKGRIRTTDARARELKRLGDKLITTAKSATLASRRSIIAAIGADAAKLVMQRAEKEYASRRGGYTRMLKLDPRKSDGAHMAIIEFV